MARARAGVLVLCRADGPAGGQLPQRLHRHARAAGRPGGARAAAGPAAHRVPGAARGNHVLLLLPLAAHPLQARVRVRRGARPRPPRRLLPAGPTQARRAACRAAWSRPRGAPGRPADRLKTLAFKLAALGTAGTRACHAPPYLMPRHARARGRCCGCGRRCGRAR
jgi:hypothetical protein